MSKNLVRPLVTNVVAGALAGTRLTAASFECKEALTFQIAEDVPGWSNGFVIAEGRPPISYGGEKWSSIPQERMLSVWTEQLTLYDYAQRIETLRNLRPVYRIAYGVSKRFPHLGEPHQDYVVMEVEKSKDFIYLNSRAWWWLVRNGGGGCRYVPGMNQWQSGVVAFVRGIEKQEPWAFMMPIGINRARFDVPKYWRYHDFIGKRNEITQSV
jgi:hypothetical protein